MEHAVGDSVSHMLRLSGQSTLIVKECAGRRCERSIFGAKEDLLSCGRWLGVKLLATPLCIISTLVFGVGNRLWWLK